MDMNTIVICILGAITMGSVIYAHQAWQYSCGVLNHFRRQVLLNDALVAHTAQVVDDVKASAVPGALETMNDFMFRFKDEKALVAQCKRLERIRYEDSVTPR